MCDTQQPKAKTGSENEIPYHSAYFGCCNRTVMTREDIGQPKFCCFCGKTIETFNGVIAHFNVPRLPSQSSYAIVALYSLSGEFAESWDVMCRMVTEEMERTEATKGHVVGQGGKCWCGETHRRVMDGAEFDLRRLCKKGLYCGQLDGHSGDCDDIPF